MRAYEVMYIVVPTLDADTADQLARRIGETVQRLGGEVDAIEPWGKRRLAYEIQSHREGIYYVMRFRGEIEVPTELRRVLGLSEHVLRSLVMRQDESEAEEAGDEAEEAADDSAAPGAGDANPTDEPEAAAEATEAIESTEASDATESTEEAKV